SLGDAAVGEDGGHRQRRRLAARAGNAAQSARRSRKPGAHRTGANGGQKRAQRTSRAAHGGFERCNPAARFDASEPGSSRTPEAGAFTGASPLPRTRRSTLCARTTATARPSEAILGGVTRRPPAPTSTVD